MEAHRDSAPIPQDGAELRETATEVLRRLVQAGHLAYFAGGCVRDRLLGIAPTDYDIATDARPEDVVKIFPRAHTVGQSFGVILVRQRTFVIQVATFRTDGVYSDGRHPDHVTFTDARHDAGRRDFTINGLFEDPLTGEVIDYVGGREDLNAKVVRAIGDPRARLREDRLRTLRAVRFAARFGFSIEAETADAIRTSAHDLKGVSRERIGQEVRRMLIDANRAVAAWEMQYLGLDQVVLGEAASQVAPTRLGRLPDDAAFPTSLGAWLLDRYPNAASQWQAIAAKWSSELMLSNDEREALAAALDVYATLQGRWLHLGVAAQKRLASTPAFNQGLLLVQTVDRQEFVDIRRRVMHLAESGLSPLPLIDGGDLIEIGLQPGPLFSRVLGAVYDAQLEGSVQNKPQALAMARAVASPDLGG